MNTIKSLFILSTIVLTSSCANNKNTTTKDNNSTSSEIEYWLTKSDQSVLLEKQKNTIHFTTEQSSKDIVEVNPSKTYQDIDGFGFTLTGGSAELINKLDPTTKKNLLQELFGRGKNSIGMDVLRISIGASDLNKSSFSYNDLPAGQTDTKLEKFDISNDLDVINLLVEIQKINPKIKIFATPWSAPAWMKTNNSLIGGSLKPEYYETYAQYFVKYIKALNSKGINIFAITPQNEPEHPGNEPSMLMTAIEQTNFIKNNIGPAFQKNNIKTKIIIYDHNCDHPEYPITVLNDAEANKYIDGSAFHLYLGDISALTKVHEAFPKKNLYFTEQYTAKDSAFENDFKWHMKNVIIGSIRNWSKAAFEWNLANDQNFAPHTPKGCTTCKGAITIEGNKLTRNVGYYIVAQASKFVPVNSKRIGSTQFGSISTVAFVLPDNKKAMVILNDGNVNSSFDLKVGDKFAKIDIPAESSATYIWN